MRNFWVLSLTGLIFVMMILSHVPDGLTEFKDKEIGSLAYMKSGKLNHSNAVEVDGMQFETAIPERVWHIPENKPGATTPVRLGITVTNNRSTPLYFSFYSDMLPDLVVSGGQSLLAGGGFEGISYPIESDFLLAMPGKHVTYLREAKLFWNDNQLLFGSHNSRVNLRLGTWVYQDIKPGLYYVRFKYRNREPQATYYKPETNQYIRLEGIWTGQVTTPFVEILLVMP